MLYAQHELGKCTYFTFLYKNRYSRSYIFTKVVSNQPTTKLHYHKITEDDDADKKESSPKLATNEDGLSFNYRLGQRCEVLST